MVLKLLWGQKHMYYWTFEKGNFQIFALFWAMKLKPLNVKARQSVQKSLNQKLVMVSISENGFEATGKTWMLWAFENGILGYLQISQWRSRNHSTESEKRHQKLFKLKFGHKKLLTKSFPSYLGLKNECS